MVVVDDEEEEDNTEQAASTGVSLPLTKVFFFFCTISDKFRKLCSIHASSRHNQFFEREAWQRQLHNSYGYRFSRKNKDKNLQHNDSLTALSYVEKVIITKITIKTVSEIVQKPGRFNDLRQMQLRIVKNYRKFCNGAGLTDKTKQKRKIFKCTPDLKYVCCWFMGYFGGFYLLVY